MFRTITLELGQKHFYATDFSASFKIVHQHAKPKCYEEAFQKYTKLYQIS